MSIVGNGVRIQGSNVIVAAYVQSPPPSEDFKLLLENGFNLLQEDSSKVLLDS